MKKIVLSMTILFSFTLLLAGCGGGGSDANTAKLDEGEERLPPDPGEAGKATLEGIDSDSDGVRDDVQIWIAEEFPEDADSLKRKELKNLAKVLQDGSTLEQPTGDGIQKRQQRISDAIFCVNKSFKSAREGTERIYELRLKILNTDERRSFESEMLESQGLSFNEDYKCGGLQM